MNKILLLLSFLTATSLTYAQAACCGSASKAASFTVGSSLNSLVLKKGSFGINLSHSGWIFRDQNQINVGDYSIADLKNVNGFSLGLHYGLTKYISLSVGAPYSIVRSEIHSFNSEYEEEIQSQTNHGFGDLTFSGTFQLPIKNKRIPDLALIAGMEFPTGKIEQVPNSIITSNGKRFVRSITGYND